MQPTKYGSAVKKGEASGKASVGMHGSSATGATRATGGALPNVHDNEQHSGDEVSYNSECTPKHTTPVRSPLSPIAAAAAIRRTTAANLAALAAAGAVVNSAAVPARPGDPDAGGAGGFTHRTPALTTHASKSASPPLQRPTIATATLGVDAAMQGPPMVPDPALSLLRINGYSGEFVRCLVWIPGSDEVAYAAASVVVLMRIADVPPTSLAAAGSPAAGAGAAQLKRPPPDPGRQRYLLGHTTFVCALAASSNGELVASAQEGKDAVVRLWDVASCTCLAILNGAQKELRRGGLTPWIRHPGYDTLDTACIQWCSSYV